MTAADAWPGVEDPAGFEAALREHARQSAYAGAGRRELFGRDGWAKSICAARVNKLVAKARKDGRSRKEQLARTINSCETRADAQKEEARAQDERAGEIERVMETVDSEIQRIDDEERSLTPGQRSGRLLGKEAVAAGVATGLTDGTAFALTISGLGGELWLRLLVASALALALNVAVMAAARTMAGLWLMLHKASRLVRILLVGVMLATLMVLVAGSLLSAGEFRHEALLNLDRGLPTNPVFLIWVGGTSAFSATIALSWWHYSSEGDRLARRRRKLEGDRTLLEQAKRMAEAAAVKARRLLFEILDEGKRARSDLDLLPDRIAAEIEQQYAEGDTLLAVAAEGFNVGKRERIAAERAKRREPTITARMERAIDKTIDEILGR